MRILALRAIFIATLLFSFIISSSPPPTTFYAIIHGPTLIISASNLYGYTGRGLSTAGKNYAKKMDGLLKKIAPTSIYCSPKLQAKETAALLIDTVLAPLEIKDALRPCDMGTTEGVTVMDKFLKSYPNHTVEPLENHIARIKNFFKERTAVGFEQVVMVVHPCFIKNIFQHLNIKPEFSLEGLVPAIFVFQYDPQEDAIIYSQTIR
jgi:broad specificity phosphatase PhoE